MKLISVILLPLVITGCASTKIVEHDFHSVVTHLENKYSMTFPDNQTSTRYPDVETEQHSLGKAFGLGFNFLCDTDVELMKFSENKELKLRLTHEFIGKRVDKITLIPENSTKTRIRVRSTDSFLLFPSRDKEREARIIQTLEDEINGDTSTGTMLTQNQLGTAMAENFLLGIIDLSTNQTENIPPQRILNIEDILMATGIGQPQNCTNNTESVSSDPLEETH